MYLAEAAAILILELALAGTPGVQESLRARAQANGGFAEDRLFSEYGVTTIQDLVRESRVIVYGRIADTQAHLNAAETQVVTDYTVTPIRLVKSDQVLAQSGLPGRTVSLTVRRRGGTVVDGPLQMRTADDAYTDGEPERGAEVVLFLGYDANQKIFYSCGGPFGVFVVREGNVEAISKEVGARRADVPMPVSQFLADLTDKLLKAK